MERASTDPPHAERRPDVGKRRRRRPSGAPPPLPRSLGMTGKLWLIAMVIIVAVSTLWLTLSPYVLDHIDSAVVRIFAEARTPWLSSLARWINTTSSRWGLALVGLGTVGLLLALRRMRHLIVLLVGLAVVELAVQIITQVIARPRPFGVAQIAGWEGFAAPSLPVAALTAVLVSMVYTLVPTGRLRWWAKWAVAVIVLGLACARMYLGVDAPSDVLLGAVLGVAIPVTLFRWFTPNDVFPISYGAHGKAAHLDVTGRRGEAIREAVHDQLGFKVLNIKPVGLEASGGSTPLRMHVIDEETGRERSVFAKLYAQSHVRADRWYKLGRRMLYGRLEDETPFGTVRRFVEYEDYTLRLLGGYRFATPAPLGVAEITPEREYLIAMEFFDGAVEIGEADVDEHLIDEGLQLIRRMWDVGLAHRDVKPANLMVLDGELKVIDVFFVQVRPSPWRQAVDLANMMLVLALRSDAETVYQHALAYFTPDELSEAFAAARGVASPTQLTHSLKRDGRDLLGRFRAMAPARRPIGIQRWSVGRVLLIVATLLVVVLTVSTSVGLFIPSKGGVGDLHALDCGTSNPMILMAQAVPTSERIPCVESLPLGWALGSSRVSAGRATFGLQVGVDSAQDAINVMLTATCGLPSAGSQVIEVGGGCITYRSILPPDTPGQPNFSADGGLSLISRSTLVEAVATSEDLELCGAGVPCP